MGIIRRMKLSDIKIRESFLNTIPIKEKMDECREYWNEYHSQDRYVVINHDGFLIDGYIQYLVLKENCIEEAEIKISHCKKKKWRRKNNRELIVPSYKEKNTTYIFGTHPNSNCTKEFCWRVTENWGSWADNIEIGDTILCQTKFGISPVIVNRVERLETPPVEMRVKKVARREIRRNGLIVEL